MHFMSRAMLRCLALTAVAACVPTYAFDDSDGGPRDAAPDASRGTTEGGGGDTGPLVEAGGDAPTADSGADAPLADAGLDAESGPGVV